MSLCACMYACVYMYIHTYCVRMDKRIMYTGPTRYVYRLCWGPFTVLIKNGTYDSISGFNHSLVKACYFEAHGT